MSDTLTASGLTTKSLSTLITELTAALKAIYGNDINVESNSPDGQQINIYCQVGVDLREVLQQINASFDPDQAEGIVLDQRVGINGITRNGGTFTFQDIEITTDAAVNLVGLDTESDEIDPDVSGLYTVKDNENNEFYLLQSQVIAAAGTNSFNFRAKDLGKVEVIPNTITTAVTIIKEVTNINNPSGANSIGIDEETDFALKNRRRVSIAITSLGYLDSIEAALQNLDNVSAAIVYENDTNVDPDSRGIPAHSIWCIVEGGDSTEIAQTIYAKKSSGSGMRGAETVNLTRPNGSTFQVKYDLADSQDLYIRFNLTGDAFDPDTIKEGIVTNVLWNIGQDGVGSVVSAYLQGLDQDFKITNMEVSDDGAAWAEVVSPASLENRFINATSRITIL
jgi:uncharacterized phage protein gp47/JayE